MRSLLLATVGFASGMFVSEARAQVGFGYGGGVYPGGAYPGGGVYSGGPVASPIFQGYSGGYGYPSPYYAGGAWQGFGPPLLYRPPYYAGYRGHIPYSYRAFGRGRTFGAYQPRFYEIYQPRPYGMFDR